MAGEKDDLELKKLGNFYGTTQYHNIMGNNCTDGIAYVFENGYGWVVTDALVILRMKEEVKKEEFVAVKLKVDDGKAKITYEDGNENVLYEQKYDFTDAKKDLTLFYTNGVLMLCSEY